jgi:hypothetical protein
MADARPLSEADVDTMRDVYMLPSQQAAYDRILAAARSGETLARRVEAAQVVYVYHYGDILRTTPPPPGIKDFVQACVALVPVAD